MSFLHSPGMGLDQVYRAIACDTKGKYSVGMSFDTFFDHFMPWNDNTPLEYRQLKASASRVRYLKAMASTPHDLLVRSRLHSAMDGWPLDDLTPNQRLNDTPIFDSVFINHQDRDIFCETFVVDIGQYANKGQRVDDPSADYSMMQTQGICKATHTADPFVDNKDSAEVGEVDASELDNNDELSHSHFPNERQTPVAILVRGQMASCAAITLHMSYRQHLFTFVVFGPFVRFVRWDRHGAIVTRRIDYTAHPDVFFEFYLRFAQLTRAQLGFDQTVQELSPDDRSDASMAKAAFSAYSEDVLHCEAQALPRDYPPFSKKLLKMTVDFGDGPRAFIIITPRFHPRYLNPFSRSTRRGLVYDTEHSPGTSGIMFMKDYWRQDSPHTKPESEIYKLLAKHEIKHVAEMEVGGDVPGMVTRSQEKALGDLCYPLPEDWREGHSGDLQCHRLFLSTVGRDLTAFFNARVLLTSLADAAEAAQMAFDKARILHRDVSAGNIVITRAEDGSESGLLIDWDHCLVLDSEDFVPHLGERTGTWPFMSALLQKRDDNIIQGPLDDKESIFWVLYYIALRYLRNDKNPFELHEELVHVFDYAGVDRHGRDFGGQNKKTTLEQLARREKEIHFTEVPSMDDVLGELARTFFVRYAPSCTPAQIARYKKHIHRGEEFVLDNPHYLQKQQIALLENPIWLQDTLRKFAQTIPLPSNPDPLSSRTVYDFYQNRIATELEGEPIYPRAYIIYVFTTRMGWSHRKFVR